MPGGGLEFACEKPKEQAEDMEHVMKALQTLESTEDKLSALCKKYAELLEEHRSMQNNMKQTQRTLSVLAREKDQLQTDHSKAVLAKSKLEGLCRELQRHNRLVKEESAARAKEDDDKRKEVAAKFQTTISEIQQQMNEHYQKNTALREENVELTKKLKGLIEQYEQREQHIDKVLKHKEVETQLYDAKLAQASLQLSEEKERNLQEKQQLLQESLDNQKKVMVLVENEKQLKAQVTMYQEKYDEFQQTLTKSNSVFQNFKNEMDKMTKKIKKLEKETTMYRQRWESSNKALLSMAEEKTRSEREVTVLQNKVSKLESLCRALQDERKKSLGGRLAGADQSFMSADKPSGDLASHSLSTGAEISPTSLDSQQPTPQTEEVLQPESTGEVADTSQVSGESLENSTSSDSPTDPPSTDSPASRLEEEPQPVCHSQSSPVTVAAEESSDCQSAADSAPQAVCSEESCTSEPVTDSAPEAPTSDVTSVTDCDSSLVPPSE